MSDIKPPIIRRPFFDYRDALSFIDETAAKLREAARVRKGSVGAGPSCPSGAACEDRVSGPRGVAAPKCLTSDE